MNSETARFRDTVALTALKEFLRNPQAWKWEFGGPRELAETAYQFADAMVKARGNAEESPWGMTFPEECQCDKGDWLMAASIPDICKNFEPEEIGGLILCRHCEHTRECHEDA